MGLEISCSRSSIRGSIPKSLVVLMAWIAVPIIISVINGINSIQANIALSIVTVIFFYWIAIVSIRLHCNEVKTSLVGSKLTQRFLRGNSETVTEIDLNGLSRVHISEFRFTPQIIVYLPLKSKMEQAITIPVFGMSGKQRKLLLSALSDLV